MRATRLYPALLSMLALTACIEETTEPLAETDAAIEADAGPQPDMTLADAEIVPDMAPIPRSCGNEDALYPNLDLASATPIEVGFARDDLFLCPEGSDHFAIAVQSGQVISLTLRTDPAETDLDLILFDANGNELDASAGETGNEQIRFTSPADGTIYAQITGAYPDQAAFYALSVQGGCAVDAHCPEGTTCNRGEGACEPFSVPDCGADANEPNDRDDQATPLVDAAHGTVCEGDRDWYQIEANDGDSYDLLVTGDVDAYVTDLSTGATLRTTDGDARTNPERLALEHLPAGRYGIAIVGGEGLRDIDFDLQIIGHSGACQGHYDCTTRAFPLCDEGVCRPVDDSEPIALGERCTADEQCTPEADLCYLGGEGGHDNRCTVRCQNTAQCTAALGEGSSCEVIDRQGTRICFGPCESDDDCSAFRACRNNTCELRGPCEGDVNCGEGESCQAIPPFGRYCGIVPPPAQCGADPEPYLANDRQADAPAIATDGAAIEGLSTCDDDEDWYQFEVTAEQAAHTLEVSVSFRENVDIDVYVYDANGSPVADATSPDQSTEVATARWIAPGLYTIYVDQFSSDRLEDTAYTIAVSLIENGDACTVAGNECGNTQPMRTTCDEATGACNAIHGQGMVALGDRCDSDNDCGPGAELCWVYEGGADGYNICTHSCGNEADCADAPGTVCTPFQGFAACLPPR